MSNNKNILIIGQGISGTMLSWYLQEANIDFKIIDNPVPNSASKVAAGIINPVTGRRIVTTWMIETLMPYAIDAYTQIGKQLNIDVVQKKEILDIFTTAQMLDAFKKRVEENAPYLSFEANLDDINVQHHLPIGTISPSYIIAVKKIIETWNDYLQTNNLIIAERFNENELIIKDDCIFYQEKHYSHLIYANGVESANSDYWKNLPFAPNKGEALIIKCPQLDEKYIYKKGMTIAPIGDQKFWVGSNYIWEYKDELPTENFLMQTTNFLNETLKCAYTIIDHQAGIRPANIERRPFVGFHPTYKNIGILSGMGAKGTSLAPYFANELVQYILNNKLINPAVDVQRFSKILQR